MKSSIKYLLFFLLLPLFSTAQVRKFKAFQTKIERWDGVKYVVDKTNEVNFLVVINFDKNKVNTYGKSEGDYDIVKKNSQNIEDDGSVTTFYDAVDEEGSKCTLTLLVFSEERKQKHLDMDGVATLGVAIKDLLIIFYLKPND